MLTGAGATEAAGVGIGLALGVGVIVGVGVGIGDGNGVGDGVGMGVGIGVDTDVGNWVCTGTEDFLTSRKAKESDATTKTIITGARPFWFKNFMGRFRMSDFPEF